MSSTDIRALLQQDGISGVGGRNHHSSGESASGIDQTSQSDQQRPSFRSASTPAGNCFLYSITVRILLGFGVHVIFRKFACHVATDRYVWHCNATSIKGLLFRFRDLSPDSVTNGLSATPAHRRRRTTNSPPLSSPSPPLTAGTSSQLARTPSLLPILEVRQLVPGYFAEHWQPDKTVALEAVLSSLSECCGSDYTQAMVRTPLVIFQFTSQIIKLLNVFPH